jgi:hypothetical protein
MAADPKRYLAIVKLAGGAEREAQDIPLVAGWLRQFAKSDHELAFLSKDRLLFGFFLRTARAQFMRAEFDKCPGTINGDELLVVEAGDLVDAIGFHQTATWLRRR